MSCLGPEYNPQPPREWYRFENRQPDTSVLQLSSTTLTPTPTPLGQSIYIPILNEYIDTKGGSNAILYQEAVYKKGNILQYKINSSNLTKSQTYAQIAKGKWQNRNKTWSSQSQQYSNPNSTSLKRVNYTYSYLNPSTGTVLPIPSQDTASFYVNADCISGESTPPTFSALPQVAFSSSSNALPAVSSQNAVGSNPLTTLIPGTSTTSQQLILIQDGGTLLGNVTVNPCTGETEKISYSTQCTPSTGSDVPGPAVTLCWNAGLQTYYPRVRRTYTDAGNKFPTNAKFLFSANPLLGKVEQKSFF
jgi:hypothetical protein